MVGHSDGIWAMSLISLEGLLMLWTAGLLPDLKIQVAGEQELVSPEDTEGHEK